MNLRHFIICEHDTWLQEWRRAANAASKRSPKSSRWWFAHAVAPTSEVHQLLLISELNASFTFIRTLQIRKEYPDEEGPTTVPQSTRAR